jgi:type IV secretion system protein VirD4
MWIFGSPGSSKTVSFVKPNTRQFGGSALVVDIKGDIYDYNKDFRNIARFAPDIPNAINESAHFNPFRNFDKLSSWELKLKIMNMAEMLIPESSKNESFFYRNGRKMFAGILLYLLHTTPDLTFPEFIHAILHHKKPKNYPFEHVPLNIFEWVECISESNCDAAIERISSMEGTNESNISGVWDEFCNGLVPFSNEILDELLTDNGNILSSDTLYNGKDEYLQISPNNLKMYAPLFTMIINSFLMDFQERSDSAINRGKNRPILVVLDEFVQLTFPYNTINSYLSTLRSKSVNLCLISQNLMQVSEKYGNYGCKALLGNCTYQICCKSNDPDTIKHFQDIIGTKKVLKQGLAATETEEPIYTNSHYSALTDKAIIKFDKFHTELKKIKSYE